MPIDGRVEEEYSDRFSSIGKGELKKADISPSKANKCPKRFNGHEIVVLSNWKYSPKRAEKYHERFHAYDIIDLSNAGISPKKANNYDERFEIGDILFFNLFGCSPKKANSYSESFNKEEIRAFVKSNISPKKADKDKIDLEEDILVKKGISREKEEEYNKLEIWPSESLIDLIEARIPPELAAEYGPVFRGREIIRLIEAGCSPTRVKEYGEFIENDGSFVELAIPNGVVALAEKKIPPEIAYSYNKKFDELMGIKGSRLFNGWDVSFLVEEGIKPDVAYSYNKHFFKKHYEKRFNGLCVPRLVKANISPEEANRFKKRFTGKNIVELIDLNISPEEADSFDKDFSGSVVVELIKKGHSPEQAKEYKKIERDNYLLIKLIKAGCSPKKAKEYPQTLGSGTIADLVNLNCSPKKVSKYDKRFYDIYFDRLIEGSISPEQANSYDKRFNVSCVALLYSIGITSKLMSSFNEKKKRRINSLLSFILYSEDKHAALGKYSFDKESKYSFIGTGNYSLILFKEGSAWKFSKNIKKEAELLKRIEKPKNVMKVKGDVHEGVGIELEYIKGKTLGEIVEKDGNLSAADTIKYGHGIMNGLIEMRDAGIWYHRDIRPQNVIVEEKNRRVVIIDLGNATTNKNAKSIHNYKFGSPTSKANDLIPLGELMYYLCTGDILFLGGKQAKSKRKEKYEIRDNRKEAYEDKSGRLLQSYINKVNKKVEDKRLRHLIRTLLKEKEDYHKIKQLFDKYAK